jgi:hypothetical protein
MIIRMVVIVYGINTMTTQLSNTLKRVILLTIKRGCWSLQMNFKTTATFL